MENFALIALAEQLRPLLADFSIRRVIQHQPQGFIFQTRSTRLEAVKIELCPQFPAVYISDSKPPLESESSDFLMVLRKHLTSAELISFRKPISERIFELEFRTVVPAKDLSIVTLVVELLPNAPNLILLDLDRRVVASLNDVSPQHDIEAYGAFASPSLGKKIGLDRVMEEDFPGFENPIATESVSSWLVANVAGIGPVFASEVNHRMKSSGQDLLLAIRNLVREAIVSTSSAWVYSELPLTHILDQNDLRLLARAVISPIPLHSMERTHSLRTFQTFLEAVRVCHDELETRTLLEREKLPILRELRTATKHLKERERKLIREQTKHAEAGALQKTAQMLTSSGMKMDQRYESAEVTDYYGERPVAAQVKLDSSRTLRENIDKMFHQHQKAGRGRGAVAKQLGEVQQKLAAIQEQTRRLTAIRDWDTWLAIAGRIQKEKGTAESGAESPKDPAKRFRGLVVDGREVLVGRSSRDNDALTFQFASPDDFWLHVVDYSGSHVVIRNPTREKDPPENVLTKAAQLAAYFSQARNSSKVEVHYTRRKNVSKPRKAKPGLVRLNEFKSIVVEPRNWLEE